MKVLKGFGVGILSFLLFVFLIAFGLVFTLDRTLLNADFVSAEINKLDLPSVAKEVASQQLPSDLKFAAPQ